MAGFAVPACAQIDFRETSWGMTQAQVVAKESRQPREATAVNGETIMRYDSISFGGLDARVVYIFVKDQLVRAKYIFEAQHSETNDFIRDFRLIDPLLVEKYGKATEARAVWEDDSTQLEPKSYLDQDRASPANILPSDPLVGLAVSLGHLKLYSSWAGSRTRVFHAMTGGESQITHQIEYRSTALAALEDEARRAGGAGGR